MNAAAEPVLPRALQAPSVAMARAQTLVVIAHGEEHGVLRSVR